MERCDLSDHLPPWLRSRLGQDSEFLSCSSWETFSRLASLTEVRPLQSRVWVERGAPEAPSARAQTRLALAKRCGWANAQVGKHEEDLVCANHRRLLTECYPVDDQCPVCSQDLAERVQVSNSAREDLISGGFQDQLV